MGTLTETHPGYLVRSTAPGAQVHHGHGGGDAPGTEEEILCVGTCICQVLEEIEGKDCVCHIKFFHCLNLEGKRGKATALKDDSAF